MFFCCSYDYYTKIYSSFFSLITYIFELSHNNIKSSFFHLLVDDKDITLSAYLKVFNVFSKDEFPGDTFEIINA
jgi:hypothetical protein